MRLAKAEPSLFVANFATKHIVFDTKQLTT